MIRSPAKIIIYGYAIAGAGVAGFVAAGGHALAAALLLWFGGALAVIALATTPGVRERFRTDEPVGDEQEELLREALALWEADRSADRAEEPGADRRLG